MKNWEIDRLIAEKVLGWEVQIFENIDVVSVYTDDGEELAIPFNFSPSQNIQHAWLVVEKLNTPIIKVLTKFTIVEIHEPYDVISARAETAPLAICLAALKAVGVQVD